MSDFVVDREQHRAWLDGEELPSVTRILKAGGIIDTTHYTLDARDRGTRFHQATEAYDLGEIVGPETLLVDIDDDHDDFRAVDRMIVSNKLGSYLKFLDEQDAEVISLEQVVHCPRFKYWGIYDRIIRLRRTGRDYLVDFKPNPAPWHRLQLGAYARRTGHTAKAALYVRENGYKWVPHHDRPQDGAEFLRIRQQVGDSWRTAA